MHSDWSLVGPHADRGRSLHSSALYGAQNYGDCTVRRAVAHAHTHNSFRTKTVIKSGDVSVQFPRKCVYIYIYIYFFIVSFCFSPLRAEKRARAYGPNLTTIRGRHCTGGKI